MTSPLNLIAPRQDRDVSLLYVEARLAGVEVSHFTHTKCRTFDGHPGGDVQLGVFRRTGTLIFYKDERRWEVRACSDAGAVDLSTLISCGLGVNRVHGTRPGHWTRRGCFVHEVSKRTGKRIAWAKVCYRLDADDLLLNSQAEETLLLDDDHRLLLAGPADVPEGERTVSA